jgi:membrane-associated HD superfamily phosphohydrolase
VYSKKDTIENFNENDYRYPYLKPQSIYGSLLMLLDVIEASVSSMKQQGKLETDIDVKEFITKMFYKLIEEEQIDNLTYKQGNKILKVLITEYNTGNNRIKEGYEQIDDIKESVDKKPTNGKKKL